MIDFLDIVGAIGEIFASWRSYVCFALAAGAIALIYCYAPASWRLALSVPVAVVAALAAILWERRTR